MKKFSLNKHKIIANTLLICITLTVSCNLVRSDDTKNKNLIISLLVSAYFLPNGKSEIVALSDKPGSIFLIGGSSKRNNAITNIFHYNDGTLKNIMNLKHQRRSHTATLNQNKEIVVIGGYDGSNALESTEIINIENNRIVFGSNLNQRRMWHTSTLLNDGRILVTGGYNADSGWLTSAEVYNPLTKQYSFVGSLNIARRLHTANLLDNGDVVIIGGENKTNGSLNSIEIFNPTSNTFTLLGTQMASRRSVHTATNIGSNKIMIVGGYIIDPIDQIKNTPTVEIFNGNNNSVSASLSLPNGIHAQVAIPNGLNNIYICGGADLDSNPTKFQDTCYDLNHVNGTIVRSFSLQKERAYPTGNQLPEGKMLICGGNNTDWIDSCEIIFENISSSLDTKLY
ncbi:Kelch repeat-containing protein [Leptospira brenneri]|uniref:Kelch repeat-containing protein n=1 Tax=Leptospira brenneri TaxID=2023182 RepID=UPI000C29E321|nr:kelch repeat-containing protein [Leptospira brenneri]PJZ45147.1 hypothetical protein CH361_13025 [Leptospira brenneri]